MSNTPLIEHDGLCEYYTEDCGCAERKAQADRIEELEKQLETERMRLAACGTAAIGYFTDCLPEYRSASLEDVLRLRQQLVERDALVERMRGGLAAVVDLINDSTGVYGLHLNGDVSPWDELRTGGRYEDWLCAFDAAIDTSLALPPSPALAEHDAEVRRKALGEVLAMWEAPYNGERFIDRLRRMANV